MKTPQIVVVGSSNTDMVVKSRHIPAPGETVTGGTFMLAPGGKGANQAVAAARLGGRVSFIAKVGADVFGEQAVEGYRKEGIVTDRILRDPDHSTGVALILVDDAGENLISVASGANHALTADEVMRSADVIRSADIVLLQLEVPMEVVECTAKLAFEAGVPVILDPAPAPAQPLSGDLLKYVTYVKPNETEAERLTGIAVRDEASARKAAEALLAAGARVGVVTLGAKGVVWVSPEGAGFLPGFPIKAVDTTAAGDAFTGGLACALARGDSLENAIRFACLVGALSATRLGAQPSLPNAAEVEAFAATFAKS